MEYATRHLYFPYTHEPLGESVYTKKIQVVQALHWINLELIATKGFFADFTSTGFLEHHKKCIKIYLWEVTENCFKTTGFVPAWKRGLEQALDI